MTPGQVVGRYRVVSRLGAGGMATVFRVEHVDLGTPFALKVLLHRSGALAERLRKEGRAQGRLQHPNVLRVVDLVELADGPALILDLANGPPLADLLGQVGRPSLVQADLLVREIARGLGAAHALGIVHRDLKPGNVLLHLEVDRVTAKVSDFGLAKVDDDPRGPRTRTGATLGTPAYMSPEQVRDPRVADAPGDVWALGVVAFELLTGRLPFDGVDLFETYQNICNGVRPRVRELAPEVPEGLERVVDAALSVDPGQRPPDADAFLARWSAEAPAFEREEVDRELRALVDRVREWLRDRPADGPASGTDSTYGSEVSRVEPVVPAPPSRRPRAWRWAALGAVLVGVGLASVAAVGAVAVGSLWYAEADPVDERVVLPPIVGAHPRPAAPVPAPVPAPAAAPAPVPAASAPPSTAPVPRGSAPIDPAPAPAPAVTAPAAAPSVDGSACADLASLEQPAGVGQLSTAQQACLEARVASSTDQQDRNVASRLLIRDAQVRMLAGGPCDRFDELIERHLDQVSQGDAALVYTWATHLAGRHPDRGEELIRWSERALENKAQLGEGRTFTDKVARLYQMRARAATGLWTAAQDRYLAGGRTPELEEVEEAARKRAKTTAREWLEFLTAAGRDASEARTLCATAAKEAACTAD